MNTKSSSSEMVPGPEVYAVVLAGGSGTRFWPKSRHLHPKQLCTIGGAKETMIELTLARLDGFIPAERRVIVTHQDQIKATKNIVGDHCQHYLAEPDARNTANALALAALHIRALHKAKGDSRPAIMVSLHADHLIENEAGLKQSIMRALGPAREGDLTLLGVVPKYPETGYGYIEKGAPFHDQDGTFKVKSFREKPPRDVAKEYLASGRFYWNAGMFVWKVDTILGELEQRLPQTFNQLRSLQPDDTTGFDKASPQDLAAVYSKLQKISIDHAVLEVSDHVAVVEADLGWQDVGSWDSLSQCFPTDKSGNLTFGDTYLLDCKDTTVDSDGPFVAAIGLQNMVVVCAKGAVLVCPQNQSQRVKAVVEWLKDNERSELL